MKLKNVAVAGVIFALAGAVPLALAGDARAPHARAYAFHFGEGGSWLGVSIQDVDAERSRDLGLDQVMGAEIKEVQTGSPAEDAGLQAGDVVLRYQGTRVEGVRQFTRLVRETPSGRTVAMEVFRDGSTIDIEATVKEREETWDSHFEMENAIAPHINMEEFEISDIEIPDIDISDIEVPDVRVHGFRFHGGHHPQRLGASVDNLTEQLGEYFGVKSGEGVLVREVEKDSPGDEAGLRAGDVIVKIDDQDISGTHDLRRAMHQRQGQEFKLTVIRERKEQDLTVRMPEKEEDVSTAPSPPAKTLRIKVM